MLSNFLIKNICFTILFLMFVLRIESFFRAHMEYKRPDGGLKIP